MNIQLYYAKNNFDVQKVKRFFKERRVPFQEVDLKKHTPGARELKLFASAAGSMKALVDPEAKGARAAYVKQLSVESIIEEELLNDPGLMRGPIVRSGSRICLGFDESTLNAWIQEVK